MILKIYDFLFEKVLDKLWKICFGSGFGIYLINLLKSNILFWQLLSIVLLFLLMMTVYLLNKMLHQNKTYRLNSPMIFSYNDLCIKINRILYENNKIFQHNAPFLNPNCTGQEETTNWHTLEETIINPNNKKILNLIEDNYNLIPSSDKDLFIKMKQHIHSFNEVINNRNELAEEGISFDYSNNRFPKDFESLIKEKIKMVNIKYINDITKFIKNSFKKNSINASKIYIYGSLLEDYVEIIQDVDLLIFSSVNDKKNIIEQSKKLQHVTQLFRKKFKKDLHIQFFSQNEENEFNNFISKLNNKEIT